MKADSKIHGEIAQSHPAKQATPSLQDRRYKYRHSKLEPLREIRPAEVLLK